MKRLTAVFLGRDKEKDSATVRKASKKPSFRRAPDLNVDTAPLPPSNSRLAARNHSGHSSSGPQSSASSSGSASLVLQTPEDEPLHVLNPGANKSRSWIPWKSDTVKPARSTSLLSEELSSPVTTTSVGTTRPRSKPTMSVHRGLDVETSDEEEEEEDDDDVSDDAAHTSREPAPTWSPVTVAQAKQTLKLTIQNSLRHRITPSPCLVVDGSHLFPRSANIPRSLSHKETLQSTMLKTRLLRSLGDNSKTFTRSEETSILPFGLRRVPALVLPQDPLLDDVALPKSCRVSGSSSGLQRWVARPCFEERYYAWVRIGETLECQRVGGTQFAVPELEFSAGLEAMAAGDDQGEPSAAPVPIPGTYLSASSSVSSLASHQSSPSHRLSVTPPQPSSLRQRVEDTGPPSAGYVSPSGSRREVRFAPDDKPDKIPDDYVQRIKKQKEEKARFLHEEKERRRLIDERSRLEIERQQREVERLGWEKERQAWEKERRAMDEERKKKQYQEQVTASRTRREMQRAGHPKPGENWSTPSPDSRRDSSFHARRPSYDKRTSDPAVPTRAGIMPSRSSTMDSPVSRPSSFHSNASRTSIARTMDIPGARASVTSFSSQMSLPTPPMLPPMPAWPANYMMVPSVSAPMSPYMPLLPPNAPFMGNSGSRSRSRDSHSSSKHSSPSASPSRTRTPSNSSSDNLASRTPDRRSARLPATPSSSSKDVRRSSLPANPRNSASYNSGSGSRGRPPVPSVPSQYHSQIAAQQRQQQQAQSPWTALPSRNEQAPTKMPKHSGYDSLPSRGNPSRRQTTIL